jgi:ADP-ribosylglycohydrolase
VIEESIHLRGPKLLSRFRGCLLGGAVGDALGAPVEFLSLPEIHERYGAGGIRDMDRAYGRIGAFTDDTQMTLFTAEGLLRSMVRTFDRGMSGAEVTITKDSYLRWLKTQGAPVPRGYREQHTGKPEGFLLGHRELFSQRAPGHTCIQALLHTPYEELRASNTSKGCGGVMRVAPVALFAHVMAAEENDHRYEAAFELGAQLAAITHGHPTGFLAAGAFAVLVLCALEGTPLNAACDRCRRFLQQPPSSLELPSGAGDETARALDQAVELATRGEEPGSAIPRLGEGWIAEEALAIALYCTLWARDFESGVIAAVNIDGDSDSTGAMTGNLLGAMHGEAAIPARWLEPLELRELIGDMAEDFLRLRAAKVGDFGDAAQNAYWGQRYPGI